MRSLFKQSFKMNSSGDGQMIDDQSSIRIARLFFLGMLGIFIMISIYLAVWQKFPDHYMPIDFSTLSPGPLESLQFLSQFGNESGPFVSIVSEGSRQSDKYLQLKIESPPGEWWGIIVENPKSIPSDASIRIRWRGTGVSYGMLVDVIDGKEEYFSYHLSPPSEYWMDSVIPLSQMNSNPSYQRTHVTPTGKFEYDNVQGFLLTFFPRTNVAIDIKQIEFVWNSDRSEVWIYLFIVTLFGFLLLWRINPDNLLAGGYWNYRSDALMVRIAYIFFTGTILIVLGIQDPRLFAAETMIICSIVFLLIVADEFIGNRKPLGVLWALRYIMILAVGWYIGLSNQWMLIAGFLGIALLPMIQLRSNIHAMVLPAAGLTVLVIDPFTDLTKIFPPAIAIIGTYTIIGILLRQLVVNSEVQRENRHELMLYAQTLKHSSDIIMSIDTSGVIEKTNNSFKLISGYTREELREKPLFDFIYPDDHNLLKEAILEENGHTLFDLRIVAADGNLRYLLTRILPIRKNRILTGYQIIATDITDRRALEARLNQANRLDSLGVLAGGVAHDFNNLLTGILGYASHLKSKVSESHAFFMSLEKIEKSTLRAANLTGKLLAFARGGGHEMRPLNMNPVIEETIEMLDGILDKSVTIKTKLDQNLPNIEGDTAQLQQVLLNLSLNARDAMPDGGELVIETSQQELDEKFVSDHIGARAGLHIVVSVSDTGVGIDKDTQSKLFEPFFTTKPKDKGTGLGLSMVYGIVTSHRGIIEVDSEPGKGSTFRFYIPKCGKVVIAKETPVAESRNGAGYLLVVDDEDFVRDLVKDILENAGYDVITAENGKEAISIYKERGDSIDLIIMDMLMPEMDGKEVFYELRKLNPGVKVLLSSGYSMEGSIQKLMEEGIEGFVQKPYKAYDLQAKVRSILDDNNGDI